MSMTGTTRTPTTPEAQPQDKHHRHSHHPASRRTAKQSITVQQVAKHSLALTSGTDALVAFLADMGVNVLAVTEQSSRPHFFAANASFDGGGKMTAWTPTMCGCAEPWRHAHAVPA
jgi:hypothetical protein